MNKALILVSGIIFGIAIGGIYILLLVGKTLMATNPPAQTNLVKHYTIPTIHIPDPLDVLYPAICLIESDNDPRAVNRSEGAVGIAQIRMICVEDVNRILQAPVFGPDDRLDPVASKEIFKIYLAHYGDRVYNKMTGKKPSLEVYARIWNGGPTGWRKKTTLGYWKKVKAELDKKN